MILHIAWFWIVHFFITFYSYFFLKIWIIMIIQLCNVQVFISSYASWYIATWLFYERYSYVEFLMLLLLDFCYWGYKRDADSGECIICPKGTWSRTLNAASCTSCPEGQTTKREGTRSPSQCHSGINHSSYQVLTVT